VRGSHEGIPVPNAPRLLRRHGRAQQAMPPATFGRRTHRAATPGEQMELRNPHLDFDGG